tara:strand:- start:452 stop:946 length:495 start_codon:yes stop_codon:yes gene_type:complete
MIIRLKNKQTLLYKDFSFKCCVGKNGLTNTKFEGDKKTPQGLFNLSYLYFRKDRVKKPQTSLNCKSISKNMGWCNDIRNKKFYNKKVINYNKIKSEKLYRKDYKYDYLIPIKYNWSKPKIHKGSAIFIHLTKNYRPTAGCIGLLKKDFLILAKLINKNTKIKIS